MNELICVKGGHLNYDRSKEVGEESGEESGPSLGGQSLNNGLLLANPSLPEVLNCKLADRYLVIYCKQYSMGHNVLHVSLSHLAFNNPLCNANILGILA